MGNDTGLCELPRNRNAENDIRMWPCVNIRQIVSIGIVGEDHGVVTPLQTNSQNFSGPGREIGRFCVNVCTNVSFKHIDLWRICIGLVIQRELKLSLSMSSYCSMSWWQQNSVSHDESVLRSVESSEIGNNSSGSVLEKRTWITLQPNTSRKPVGATSSEDVQLTEKSVS